MKSSELIAAYNPEEFVLASKDCGAPIYVAPSKHLVRIDFTTVKSEAEKWSYRDTQSVKAAYYSQVCGMKFEFISLKDTVLALEHEDEMTKLGFYNVRCLDYKGKLVMLITERDADIMQVAGLSVENPTDIFEYINHLQGGRFLKCITLTKF